MLRKACEQQWRPSVAKVKQNKNSPPTPPNFFLGAFFLTKVISDGGMGWGWSWGADRNWLDQLLLPLMWVTQIFFFFFYKNILVKTGGGRGRLIIVSKWKWLTYLQHDGKVQLQDLELFIYWLGQGSMVHVSGWAGHFVHRKLLQDAGFTVNS